MAAPALLLVLACAAPGFAQGRGPGPKIINVPSTSSASPAADLQKTQREMLLRELSPQLTRQLWIEDFTDLERAYYEGALVDVPSDSIRFGIELRLEGASRIGELEVDPVRQSMLCRASKPAAGLLYRLADRLRLIEGTSFQPLVVTSLVRPWQYQQRLSEVNPNADATRDGVPPTHVLGLAFDIARSGMSGLREERVEAVLAQFAADGELAFYKEGGSSETYHVIALPSAAEQLTEYWEKLTGEGDRRQQAEARHNYVPESPCVRFGSGLEPYSSICTCDIPVDLQPSTAVADGG